MRAIFKLMFKVVCILHLKGPKGLAFRYPSRIVVLDLEKIMFGVIRCKSMETQQFLCLCVGTM